MTNKLYDTGDYIIPAQDPAPKLVTICCL